MKNTIYADADLNIELIVNEEQDGNTIAVVIECDSAASQELTITAGTATTTEALTSGTKNTVDIPVMLWNFGDDTVITLSKGGTDAGTITIHFPGAIDSDAAINETETDGEVTMQGSASVQEQIVSLQESVERVSAQTLAYILPSAVSQTGIADGGSNTVETFEFEAGAENVKVSFFTCVQFLAETTVTAANAYEDLMLTITITVDGVAAATIIHTYRDGRQVLTLNHLIENLSKGNHTMTVSFAAAGGSVSVIQIIAAYLLTAKSTGSGSTSLQTLFENGEWAPGVLADGLDANKMTEYAFNKGIEDTIIKYSKSANPQDYMPNISTLDSYFLTQYILCNGQHYAEAYYQKDNYFRKSGTHGEGLSPNTGQPVGFTSVDFYIPIKRLTGFNTLKFDGKTIKNNGTNAFSEDYNVVKLGCAAVVDGVMQKVYSQTYTSVENWTTYTVDISSLPYVDYIVFCGADGSPAYKNIKLLRS